jgi:predicted Ser/Thr protein kinase
MNIPEPTDPGMEQKCPQCGAPLPSGVLAGLCPVCLMKQGTAGDTAAGPEPQTFQPPSVPEMAALFPQLEILSLIGKGGMGAVYKARQPGLDRIVALKILPPHAAAGPGFIERFNREARALARLNHPNIVAVYEFGQVQGLHFFIMEYVAGLNLREVEMAGRLSPAEALRIVPQICDALQFAHEEGIVHRDIKPENILLDKKGRVKIADFGIAKILSGGPDPDLTATQGVIGTPHYMAPEQMEKPASVDHRADIFSLGVVFYEMLTGELPLGKFQSPSARKVEVDVRLDDVVLRSLEKDPERRYQRASQVKTAVDNIASAAAPPPAASGSALAGAILARDYSLNIRACLRRAEKLLRGEFWPLVGVTALMLVLLDFAGVFGGVGMGHGLGDNAAFKFGATIALFVWGPLMGGLLFYLLKKIRMEPATVETAFSGFSGRNFLHLFLAGFVVGLLSWLGFLLIVPGIYLVIAWMFTLPLILDQRLDFWSAMELSRRVVTKHWFKALGFVLVLLLLNFAGLLAFGFGIFFTMPFTLAALMCAYDDIFGVPAPAPTRAAGAATGPSGTVVTPGSPASVARPAMSRWIWIAAIGLVLVFVAVFVVPATKRPPPRSFQEFVASSQEPASASVKMPMSPPAPPAPLKLAFGPVIECKLDDFASGSNCFLNLADSSFPHLPPAVADALAVEPSHQFERRWEGVDISPDSRASQYLSWLKENGVDLMYAGDGKIVGFDGVFVMAHGDSSSNWDDLESLKPDRAGDALRVANWGRAAAKASAAGLPIPAGPSSGGGIIHQAMQVDSSQTGNDRVVSVLTRNQAVNWYFETRGGAAGVLQIANMETDPAAVLVRYRLLTSDRAAYGDAPPALSANPRAFDTRLNAATNISNPQWKDQALSALAADAAASGNVEIVTQCLALIERSYDRDQTAAHAAESLGTGGLKDEAVAVAKGIENPNTRNAALAELAR